MELSTLAFLPFGLSAAEILATGFAVTLIASLWSVNTHLDKNRKLRERRLKDREQTYREVAAYVAEGTIPPESAERMIRAMGDYDEEARARFEFAKREMLA
jgi:HEAT repeat protein